MPKLFGVPVIPEAQAQAEAHLRYWLSCDNPPKEFVYIIQAEGDTPIKIGRAVDVQKRIASLQTGNPRPLRLLCVMPGAGELEWQLHYRMRESRVVGEWFDGKDVPGFIAFAKRLALYLLDEQRRTGSTPGFMFFKSFEDGWAFRGDGRVGPTTVTFTDPDPEAVRRAAELRERTPEVRLTDREKAERWNARKIPTFSPHKRP